ncbi:MAG: metal ion transporter substrate-binding protein [Micavibrio sp.]|nr:metal ion transporter substrate-binding protein [Micavibrio sp.]
MKRLTYLILAFTVLMPHMAQAETRIFACEPEWAALANEIGGDKVAVTSATSGTEDPHHVRAKPSLLAAMRRADVVFCTGAGLEAGWLPVLMQQAADAQVQPGNPGNLMASSFVRLMNPPAKIDRAMGDVHPEGNPHIQTDPRNIVAVAKGFTERLAQIDVENAGYYQGRLGDFTQRFQGMITASESAAKSLKGAPVVVYHDEWAYLNRWLGLNEVATLEAKPGIPPTASHLQDVLATSRNAGVKMILLAPFDDDQAAKWLAGQIGAKIVRLPFTVGGRPGTETLQATFETTVKSLTQP